MIISTHSPNQEIPEYPQRRASIFHSKKLYQVHFANSTGHDCLVLLQFDLIDTYFYSRSSLLLIFFDLRVVPQVDKNICMSHLQVVLFLLDTFCLVGRCQFNCILWLHIIDDFCCSFCSQFYSNF